MRSPAVLLALSLVTIGRISMATEYYVAPSGSDSATGSATTPWASIAKAATAVVAGDRVHVAPGTYTAAVHTTKSGTSGARIVYISDVHWGAKLVVNSFRAWENDGDYVDIIGFDVTGTGSEGIFNTASYTRMIGNHVHDIPAPCGSNGGAGIDNGNYSAHDADILGNVVHDIGVGGGGGTVCSTVHGIYHSNLRGHVSNNISYRNVGWGIHTWHAPVDVVISNNLVFENLEGGIIVGAGDAPGGIVADGFLVTNNIAIYNHGHAGIIEYGTTGTKNQYVDNLVFGNSAGGFSLQNGNTDTGTLKIDPMLLNYQGDGTGDYHLAKTSPCVDHGASTGAPVDDLDGNARPQGAGIDIGPYEYIVNSPIDGGTASDAGGSPDAQDAQDAGAQDANALPDQPASSGECGCGVVGHERHRFTPAVMPILFVIAYRLRRRRREGISS